MPDDIFSEEDGEVIEVGGDTPPPAPPQAQRATLDPQGPAPSLRAEWDQQGRCWVALFQGDRQLEKWRPPTKVEWDALKARGVLTRPSPLAPVGAAPMVTSEPTLLDRVKQNAVPFTLGAFVAAGLLKYGHKLFPRSNPVQASPAEGGEDVDDDDDGDDGDGSEAA